MRDYGVVRIRFWDWAKRKKLSPEAKEMALYLLTCPHGNSLGCFRLPMAYLCDDLDTTAKIAGKMLEELQGVGFVHLDKEESTGWIWIVDYLEHNPPPNGNVGKAIGKMLEQVPHAVSFYADLLAILHGVPHFPDNLIDTLRERYLNGIDTGFRPIKTHTQTQTQDPTHEQDHITDADAPDADAAFALFLEAAKKHGWVEAKSLDADRRRKLTARIAEHGADGWAAMLERAGQSEFLRTEFRLKLDWVLEPKNFRKVVEGNYDGKSSSPKPTMQTMPADDADQWRSRLRDYTPGAFWPSSWGPRPGEPGCFVPPAVLAEFPQARTQ